MAIHLVRGHISDWFDDFEGDYKRCISIGTVNGKLRENVKLNSSADNWLMIYRVYVAPKNLDN